MTSPAVVMRTVARATRGWRITRATTSRAGTANSGSPGRSPVSAATSEAGICTAPWTCTERTAKREDVGSAAMPSITAMMVAKRRSSRIELSPDAGGGESAAGAAAGWRWAADVAMDRCVGCVVEPVRRTASVLSFCVRRKLPQELDLGFQPQSELLHHQGGHLVHQSDDIGGGRPAGIQD